MLLLFQGESDIRKQINFKSILITNLDKYNIKNTKIRLLFELEVFLLILL